MKLEERLAEIDEDIAQVNIWLAEISVKYDMSLFYRKKSIEGLQEFLEAKERVLSNAVKDMDISEGYLREIGILSNKARELLAEIQEKKQDIQVNFDKYLLED